MLTYFSGRSGVSRTTFQILRGSPIYLSFSGVLRRKVVKLKLVYIQNSNVLRGEGSGGSAGARGGCKGREFIPDFLKSPLSPNF